MFFFLSLIWLIYDLIRYHHVLKSHYLDSKWNWHIDRVVYTLVKHLEPHFRSRHARQTIGFEGPDLAAARRAEIRASARDMALDSVLNFDSSHFHVASQSHPGEFYAIDLIESICDCPDFPRIRFCKHIAAVYLHFPHLSPGESTAPVASEHAPPTSTQPERAPTSSYDALRALTQESTHLLQNLASETETMCYERKVFSFLMFLTHVLMTRSYLLACLCTITKTRLLMIQSLTDTYSDAY